MKNPIEFRIEISNDNPENIQVKIYTKENNEFNNELILKVCAGFMGSVGTEICNACGVEKNKDSQIVLVMTVNMNDPVLAYFYTNATLQSVLEEINKIDNPNSSSNFSVN